MLSKWGKTRHINNGFVLWASWWSAYPRTMQMTVNANVIKMSRPKMCTNNATSTTAQLQYLYSMAGRLLGSLQLALWTLTRRVAVSYLFLYIFYAILFTNWLLRTSLAKQWLVVVVALLSYVLQTLVCLLHLMQYAIFCVICIFFYLIASSKL